MRGFGQSRGWRVLGILALCIYAVPAGGTAALIAVQHRSFAAPQAVTCCSEPSSEDHHDPAPVHDPNHCPICLQLLVWKSAVAVDVRLSGEFLDRSYERPEFGPFISVIPVDMAPDIAPRAPPLA